MTFLRRGMFLAALVLVPAVFASVALAGQFQTPEGSKDHALVPRFPGAEIVQYDHKKFDEFTIPLSIVPGENTDDYAQEGKIVKMPPKWEVLEGEVTRIRYFLLGEHSSLEVYKNYENLFKKKGFTVLLPGKEKIDSWWGHEFSEFAGEDQNGERWGAKYFGSWGGGRYLAARKSGPRGDVYVALGAQEQDSYGTKFVAIWVNVVEVGAMVQSIMDSGAMAKSISETGSVALYGIYFDTGKAEIKPGSEATLKAIAELMQKVPALKLYVVGHTDNQGALAYNLGLSKRRAAAVLKELAGRYRVPAARLAADGVGPLAPRATNLTEDGRAKNRRVELVAQ